MTSSIGARCVCEEHYGTVRFTGPVPPTSGEWIGVEWDDTSRGKHDGTYEGEKYFTCSKSGNCGSFVRRKKLLFGHSYKKIVEKKYGEPYVDDEDITIGDIGGSMGKKVELFGFDKQAKLLSHFSSLEEVDLRESFISSAGADDEISTITPNVTSLDLTKNLLSTWEEVGRITVQLPHLRKLLLCENRLIPTQPTLPNSFKHITILYINKMGVDWIQLSYILSLMPFLQELYAFQNSISSLGNADGAAVSTTSKAVFPDSLRILNLEENHLSEWRDVLQLQHLPHLESLGLNDNKLSTISGMNNNSFPNLKTLSLSNNTICKWSEIYHLNVLPRLESLRFVGNLVHRDESPFFNRQLTIAHLHSIKYLNNSEVTKHELVESERYYVKKYANEWLVAEENGTKENFLRHHPCYFRHVTAHGLPAEVVENRNSNKPNIASLKNRLIPITVLCPERPDLPKLDKKLPDSMTVQKLKGLLQRVFKIKSSDQILTYRSHKMTEESEIEMNDDLKQLSYYSIEAGDTILLRTQ